MVPYIQRGDRVCGELEAWFGANAVWLSGRRRWHGLLVNEVPTFRLDAMPYGGVKGSGTGREEPRYAVQEMTEPRLLVQCPLGAFDS